MRTPLRIWLPMLLGVAILVSFIGFGSFAGPQAQAQAATVSVTVGMTVPATRVVTASTTSTTVSVPLAPSGNTVLSPTPAVVFPCPLSAGVTMTVITETPTVASPPPTNSPATMAATVSGRAYLGIAASAIDLCGIRVANVIPTSPAEKADVRVGDVIVAVNGQSVASIMANGASTTVSTSATASATGTATTIPVQPFFTFIETNFQPDQTITLTIQRGNLQLDIAVTLGTIPPGLITGTPSTTPTKPAPPPPANAMPTSAITATAQPSPPGTVKPSPTAPATGSSPT